MSEDDVPSTRERKVLEALIIADWEAEANPNPGQAGEGTFKAMADKGWIERRRTPNGIKQARITEAGRAALKRPIPAKPVRPRLKMLRPKLKELPPKISPRKRG